MQEWVNDNVDDGSPSWIDLYEILSDDYNKEIPESRNADSSHFAFAYCIGYAKAKGIDVNNKTPGEIGVELGVYYDKERDQ